MECETKATEFARGAGQQMNQGFTQVCKNLLVLTELSSGPSREKDGTSARSKEKGGARLRGLSTLKQHCKGPPRGNRATPPCCGCALQCRGLGRLWVCPGAQQLGSWGCVSSQPKAGVPEHGCHGIHGHNLQCKEACQWDGRHLQGCDTRL